MRNSLRSSYPKHHEVLLLIGTAIALLALGLNLPLFHVTQMVFWRSDYSVLTGVVDLARQKEYFLAGIIFIFSVVFPIVKLFALSQVWLKKLSQEEREKMLRWLGLLGRWSMLDVLLLALTILAVKMQAVAKVEARIGVYIFCAAIALSMLATTRVEMLVNRSSKKN